MKKVLREEVKEESVYYSDASGKCFGMLLPEAEVEIRFNYGSKRDGEKFILHLSDSEAEELLGKFLTSKQKST